MKKNKMQEMMDILYGDYMINMSALNGKVNERGNTTMESPTLARFCMMYAGPSMAYSLLEVLNKLEADNIALDEGWDEIYENIIKALEKAGIHTR